LSKIKKAIDTEALAEAQEQDKELKAVLEEKQLGIKLKKIPIPGLDKQIYCDVTQGRPRPYVTQQFRKQVFLSHGLAHPGVRATVKLITERYIWKNIRSDCTRWTQACVPTSKD